MAAKRIIPILHVRGGRTVIADRFGASRDAGHPAELACRLELEGADGILFRALDRDSHPGGDSWITEVAHALSIPFLLGGAIRTLEEAEAWLTAGADAIAFESAVLAEPERIGAASARFGSAAVMVSVDVVRDPVHRWKVRLDAEGRAPTRPAVPWLWDAVEQGAGGLLLRALDREGTRTGFDLELLQETVHLPVPILAAGGAGNEIHVLEAMEFGADGVGASTLFQELQVPIGQLKTFLAERGLPVRL